MWVKFSWERKKSDSLSYENSVAWKLIPTRYQCKHSIRINEKKSTRSNIYSAHCRCNNIDWSGRVFFCCEAFLLNFSPAIFFTKYSRFLISQIVGFSFSIQHSKQGSDQWDSFSRFILICDCNRDPTRNTMFCRFSLPQHSHTIRWTQISQYTNSNQWSSASQHFFLRSLSLIVSSSYSRYSVADLSRINYGNFIFSWCAERASIGTISFSSNYSIENNAIDV